MIGFLESSKTFSLAAIQVLQTKSNELYINSGSDLTPLTETDPVNIAFNEWGVDETLIYEDIWIDNVDSVDSFYGINIEGTIGANQTVIIKNSKFTNMTQPINILYVDNVIIEGNYIAEVFKGIMVYKAKNLSCKYNKFKNYAVLPAISDTLWSGNFIQVGLCTFDSLDISYNLADRSGDTRENLHENCFAEDHLSIYRSKMTTGNTGNINNNYIMGSETVCESIGGGGITIDQYGDGFLIDNNFIYNTGSFPIGLASSQNCTFTNNLAFMTSVHDTYVITNARHSFASGPDRNTQLVITNWVPEGEDPVLVSNITVENNRMLAYREDLTKQHQWLDVDLSELTMTVNSFIKHKWDGTGGVLSEPTQQEVYEAIVGADEAGMFLTHGTDPEYFNENRTSFGTKIFEIDFSQHAVGNYSISMQDGDFIYYNGEYLHPRNYDGSYMPGDSHYTASANIVDDGTENVLDVFYKAGEIGFTESGLLLCNSLPKNNRPAEDVNNPTEITLEYSFKFASGDLRLGGKLPGLAGGNMPTGGLSFPYYDAQNGFSARFSWQQLWGLPELPVPPAPDIDPRDHPVGMFPYIYAIQRFEGRDGSGDPIYGTGPFFNSTTPPTNWQVVIDNDPNSFQPEFGRWYKITQSIRANTPNNENGTMQVRVDDVLMVDIIGIKYVADGHAGEYTTDRLCFSTFYGGGSAIWAPLSDSHFRFKDLKIYER